MGWLGGGGKDVLVIGVTRDRLKEERRGGCEGMVREQGGECVGGIVYVCVCSLQCFVCVCFLQCFVGVGVFLQCFVCMSLQCFFLCVFLQCLCMCVFMRESGGERKKKRTRVKGRVREREGWRKKKRE